MLFGSSFLKTGMTSATFNASGKDFTEMHLLIQFVIGIKIYFLANLIMAGDISPLELFIMSISFMYLKILSAETNSNLKLKDFLNLIFYCFDTCVIAKVVNFFSNIQTILRDIAPRMFLYVHAKNLVKVTGTGQVKDRKRRLL